MKSSRHLRKMQAAMRRKRGVRPWDYALDDAALTFVVRMRKMVEAGYTDEFIASALNLTVGLVSLLRSKRYTGLKSTVNSIVPSE